MLEEHDRVNRSLNSTRPSRIRLFIFSIKPEPIGSMLVDRKSESWFSDALNITGIIQGVQSADKDLDRELDRLDSNVSLQAQMDNLKNVADNAVTENGIEAKPVIARSESLFLKPSPSFGSTNSLVSPANLPANGIQGHTVGMLEKKIRVPSSASIAESDKFKRQIHPEQQNMMKGDSYDDVDTDYTFDYDEFEDDAELYRFCRSPKERKGNRLFTGIFAPMDKLSLKEFSYPGAIDWSKGFQPLVKRPKNKRTCRVKRQWQAQHALRKELKTRKTSAVNANSKDSKTAILAKSYDRHTVLAAESRVSIVRAGVRKKVHDLGKKVIPLAPYFYMAGSGPMDQIEEVRKKWCRDDFQHASEIQNMEKISENVADRVDNILEKLKVHDMPYDDQVEFVLVGSKIDTHGVYHIAIPKAEEKETDLRGRERRKDRRQGGLRVKPKKESVSRYQATFKGGKKFFCFGSASADMERFIRENEREVFKNKSEIEEYCKDTIEYAARFNSATTGGNINVVTITRTDSGVEEHGSLFEVFYVGKGGPRRDGDLDLLFRN